jgi:preprotein translocase subunit SecG
MRKITISLVAAFAAAALAVGCSSARRDQDVATDIKARMFSDPQVKSASVEVTVKDGEATLAGDVPDSGARLEAFKVARDTPGVKHVVDKMTGQTAEAAPAPAEPAPPAEPVRSTPKHRAVSRPKPTAGYSGPEPTAAPTPTPVNVATEPVTSAAPPPPASPQPTRLEIPAGTSVRVQMIDGVDSAVNHAGEMFHASLEAPIVVNDQIVVPAGTDMYVKLVNAKSAGRMTGQSQLALELVRMDFQGKSYGLVSNDYTQTGSSRGKRTAETIGGGAAIGAVLGAIIGHGKGAAIGAATGAGAGTVAEAATKGQQVKISSETKLDFVLDQPVEVSYFPDRNHSFRH